MTLEFPDQLTVLTGSDGAGKSSILDALAILLSQLTARIVSERGRGRTITESDICNGQLEAECAICVEYRGEKFEWSLAKQRKGKSGSAVSRRKDLRNLATSIRELNSGESPPGLPLAVSYGVNRAVLEVPLRIRESNDFNNPVSAYDSALSGGANNFRAFFEWFREQEDYENEQKVRLGGNGRYLNPQLEAVRRAIQAFTDFFGIRVQRKPRLQMLVQKGSQSLDIRQMSDGEKCFLALIGDLARRLGIANPSLEDPLHGTGVVLIDEIDLHLHPSWQRMVVPKLCEVFPGCQFILSTHSPQVLGEVDARNIRCLHQEADRGIQWYFPGRAKGLEASEVLEEVMGTGRRNKEVARRLESIFHLIDEEKFEDAKQEIHDLREELGGDIPDLIQADALVFMMSGDQSEGESRGN